MTGRRGQIPGSGVAGSWYLRDLLGSIPNSLSLVEASIFKLFMILTFKLTFPLSKFVQSKLYPFCALRYSWKIDHCECRLLEVACQKNTILQIFWKSLLPLQRSSKKILFLNKFICLRSSFFTFGFFSFLFLASRLTSYC